MWDTWLYYHEGVHYLYYLHETSGACFDGMSVATSTDGVHYSEVGSIIEKRDDAEWLGTGSIWRAGDRFVLNFSEQRNGVQAIFFAVSDDLIHWQRLGDEYRCDPDPRWYDNTPTGRWDCIWAIPRPGGGFCGYLTARPWSHTPGLTYESVGKVESEDGLHWRAAEPPQIDWGEWPRMDLGEVGAIERIGERYYLIVGAYAAGDLGNRHDVDVLGRLPGMYVYVGDSPEGPFQADTGAYRLLATNVIVAPMATYFARFYPTPGGMLLNHHSISRANVRWLPPLKRVVVDGAGHLRLGYWEGNDAAKGKPIDLDLAHCLPVQPKAPGAGWVTARNRLEIGQPHGGGLVLLPHHFNLERGVILEGQMTVHEPTGRWSGIGLYVEQDAARHVGTAILAETRGRSEIGVLRHGRSFTPDDAPPIGIAAGCATHFRLFVRQGLIELYLNDRLVQCYSLPEPTSGRLGLVFESGRAVFESVRAWEMNL